VRRSRQRQARPSTMTLTPMYPAPTPERCSSVDYLRTWMQASLHVLGQCVLCTHVYVCSLCGCVRLQCVWEFLCVVANIYSSNVQCICVQCVNVVGEVGVTAIVHFPVQMISSGTSFSLGTFWWTGLTKPELEHCSLPKVTTSLLLTPPSPLLSPPSPLCITSVITPTLQDMPFCCSDRKSQYTGSSRPVFSKMGSFLFSSRVLPSRTRRCVFG